MPISFEVSPNARILAEFLLPLEQATYDEMNKLIGKKINGNSRHILYRALRQLQRDHEIIFVVDRGVGLVRATNAQVATLSTDHVAHKVRRTVHRGKRMQPIVNTQELTSDQRDAFYIGRAVTQMLDAAVGRKMRSQVAEEIKDRGEAVDISRVVALFKKRAH